VINNRKAITCDRCKKSGSQTVHADDFDDTPASFTMKQECEGPCKPLYQQMTAKEMHDRTGLPLSGWSETRY
jgi:hypothetical protein